MAKKKKNETSASFTIDDFMKYENNYEKKNIADETMRYSIISGINRNVARHIPLGYDGLKPVSRRILIVLNKPSYANFQKVNKIAGEVMGDYHPHGNTAIEEVIGKMGQWWNNNIMYIVPDGNFGTQQGDSPAAGRYIKCKMSNFARKCFFEDYKYAALDMKPTYTGDGTEPEYLPTKYPVALINPQFSSIGYGTAANIAPYNLTEVLEATIKLIENPKTKINLIPDFPNGCEILADKKLDEINTNGGRGQVKVRSKIDIDHEKNIIKIFSTPLKVGTDTIRKNIASLVIGKKVEGILDIKDSTSPSKGVYMEIILQKDVNPEKMLEFLIKKDVGLQKTFGVQIKFIEDYHEVDFTPTEYLLNWLNFRREIIQSMYNKKYIQLREDQHMNDIKIFVFSKDNINKTVKIIRKSHTDDEGIKLLMEEYKDISMTSLQAKTICNMRVREFNKESYDKFLKERDRLKEELKEAEKIILNPKLIDDIIVKELKEGIDLFGTPRKSKVIYEEKAEKKIPEVPMIISISKDGYVKKLDANKYATIGKCGNISSQEVIVIKMNNNNHILVLDSNGKISKVPIVGIPEMTPEENGVLASRYFNVTGQIVSVMEELDKSVAKDVDILFVTKNGFAKRTSFEEFLKFKDLKTSISLNDGDQLVTTQLIFNSNKLDDIIIFTNKGNGIRLNLSDIQKSGASSKGKRMITLNDNEEIAGVDRILSNKKLLFYITSSGKGKITEAKFFPKMDKKDAPLSLLPLSVTDKLVSVVSVNKTDKVLVYRKQSDPEVIEMKDINPSLRVAKPDKLVKVPKGDIVVGARLLLSK